MGLFDIAPKNTGDTVSAEEFNDLLLEIKKLRQATGWADYVGTQYTASAPFTVTTAQGKVALPNNAATVRDAQKPVYLESFYQNGKITGRNGDAFQINVEFRVRPTSGAGNVRVQTSIDLGGTVGEIYPRSFTLSKGSGQEHLYLASFGVYTLNTFEANGGTILVEAINSNVEIYDVRYVFFNFHKARTEQENTPLV